MHKVVRTDKINRGLGVGPGAADRGSNKGTSLEAQGVQAAEGRPGRLDTVRGKAVESEVGSAYLGQL